MRLLRNPLILAVLVTAAGAAVWVMVFPRIGTDLAAHVARAGWARQYPGAAYLFSWYGGIYPASYSLLTPYLLAAVGVHAATAAAAIASAALLALLMVRHRVPRPRAAALWGAVAVCAGLSAGRAAFTLGLAAGLASLAVLDAARARRSLRLAAATALAALSSLFSPVTGLFLAVTAAAYFLTGRRRDGLVIAAAAGLPLAAAAVFSDGGVQPIDARNGLPSLLAVVLVLLLVPRRWRLLRTGAVVYGLGVLAAWAMPTPAGSNVERLASLLAGPVLAGMAEPRVAFRARAAGFAPARWAGPLLAAGLVAAAGWQVTQPALDIAHGNGPPDVPGTAALVRELGMLHADTARVEAVPQYGHWEAQQLASAVPLARGGNGSSTPSATRSSTRGCSHRPRTTPGFATTRYGTSRSPPRPRTSRRSPRRASSAPASRGWRRCGMTPSGPCTRLRAPNRSPPRPPRSPPPRPPASPCG